MEVACLALQDVSCLLDFGNAAATANKTILVFIQDEDGAVSAHNNEGNLRCHLVFVTSLYRFLFSAPSKTYTINTAVVTCIATLFCRHEAFKAPGFNTCLQLSRIQ